MKLIVVNVSPDGMDVLLTIDGKTMTLSIEQGQNLVRLVSAAVHFITTAPKGTTVH